MNRADRSKACDLLPKGVLSAKILSIFLVGLLVVGTVPTTHSYPSAKADFNNIWLAAKEFWDSLHFFRSRPVEQETQSNTEDSLVVQSKPEMAVENTDLEKLKTHPQCRSVYVSEYLPTFNTSAIEKCERIIQQHEQHQLFNAYVQQLCQNPGSTMLNRKQIGEVQLRLRKYALMFPQSEIVVTPSDIDGIYGSRTCQMVANYQIKSKSDIINGIADTTVYSDLAAAIPLTDTELAGLYWQPSTQSVVDTGNEAESSDDIQAIVLPSNPFKRIVFCLKNSHLEQCRSGQQTDLARAVTDSR